MRYALVTGAAQGIGAAIAGELAERGYNLLLTDIDEYRLRQTAALITVDRPVKISLYFVDLSEDDAALRLLKWSRPYHDYLTVVVNNAGYGINAAFIDRPLPEHLELINVNIKALMSISHLFVPILFGHQKSWLLNVGSTTSYQTVPYLNTYAASKAFVLSFTRGLRRELKGSSISVSCLSPGSTDTDFVNRAGMSVRTKKVSERYNMTPDAVAAIAIKGLFAGKAEIIPGLTNKFHAFFAGVFPKSFIENIAARLYRPLKQTRSLQKHIHLEEEEFLTA